MCQPAVSATHIGAPLAVADLVHVEQEADLVVLQRVQDVNAESGAAFGDCSVSAVRPTNITDSPEVELFLKSSLTNNNLVLTAFVRVAS